MAANDANFWCNQTPVTPKVGHPVLLSVPCPLRL
jgi:hypothetical protein